MVTAADDVTVDFDAVDREVARGKANGAAAAADPAPVVVETEAAEPAAPAKEVLKPEEGIEKLQKQLATEKNLRLAAEARERETANSEAEARGRVQTSELDLVKSAIDQVKQSDDALEKQYADAFAAQDGLTLAKIQRQMATNAARLEKLEAGKVALEKAPKPIPRAPVDPVEAYVERIGSQYPRSQAWLREHPEFATDKRKEQQMISAHNLAVSMDLAPDSDEYFESIEKSLRLTPVAPKPEPTVKDPDGGDDPTSQAAQATAKGRPANGNAAPAAAPVTRSGGTSRKGTITLTKEQVEAAEVSGLSVEEYAKQVLALRN